MITINRALFKVLEPSILITRAFGFLPIKCEQNGNYYRLEKSWKFCCFSCIWALFLLSSSIAGITIDANSTHPVRSYNGVGKYVTFCDMGEIMLTCFFIMVTTPCKLQTFWQSLDCCQHFDKILFVDRTQHERTVALRFIIGFLGPIVLNICYDIILWSARCPSRLPTFFLRNLPFYLMYFLCFVQQLLYWQINRLIENRLGAINKQLMKYRNLGNSHGLVDLLNVGKIMKLMKLYNYLYAASDFNNHFSALGVLLTLFSCLLHLVVTPYYFLILISVGGDIAFILLDAFWIWLHISRLLVIVESCHKCLDQHKKTIALIYTLLHQNYPEEVKECLRLFALQLTCKKLVFTPFSLLKIKRSLLTSIASAVGTFVVILFQFGSLGTHQI